MYHVFQHCNVAADVLDDKGLPPEPMRTGKTARNGLEQRPQGHATRVGDPSW